MTKKKQKLSIKTEHRDAKTEQCKKNKYWINYWRGMKKYNCCQCSFDSFKLKEIEDHIRTIHPLKIKPREPEKIPVKDRFGNSLLDKNGNQLYK